MEKEWLDSLAISDDNRSVHIQLSENYKIVADAFDPITNTIYEFHGDFWHGNPKIYDQDATHSVKKHITYGELFKQTMLREQIIKDSGYNLITIWEKDWLESKNRSTN